MYTRKPFQSHIFMTPHWCSQYKVISYLLSAKLQLYTTCAINILSLTQTADCPGISNTSYIRQKPLPLQWFIPGYTVCQNSFFSQTSLCCIPSVFDVTGVHGKWISDCECWETTCKKKYESPNSVLVTNVLTVIYKESCKTDFCTSQCENDNSKMYESSDFRVVLKILWTFTISSSGCPKCLGYLNLHVNSVISNISLITQNPCYHKQYSISLESLRWQGSTVFLFG